MLGVEQYTKNEVYCLKKVKKDLLSKEVRREKGEEERKIVEWRREPVKPRKACRIELGEGEPPSKPTRGKQGRMEEEEDHYPSYISRYIPCGCSWSRNHRVDGRITII